MKIGIIGDSWVYKETLDKYIVSELSDIGIDAEVVSVGRMGAKSSRVSKDLVSPENNEYSSRHILMDNDIDFIIVIAGVNDTIGHVGKRYYARHMLNIVTEINNHNKLPLILEVPAFGIREKEESAKSRLKHAVYRWLFDFGKQDIIADYRDALSEKLLESKQRYEIMHFPEELNYYNHQTLYAEPLHLHRASYAILGSRIARHIAHSN